MKFFTIMFLIFSVNAVAKDSGLFTAKEKSTLEGLIKKAIMVENDLKDLKGFKVDWKGLKCLNVKNEMQEESKMGVCHLPAHAFQVQSHVSIVKTWNNLKVEILFTNIE